MTTLFEVRVCAGGDPRDFVEYEWMREELGKLSHPACPVVDWFKVDQLCLALFSKNGAELQTVASYTLARSHLRGLEGMLEGVSLVEMLICDGADLWPPAATTRAEILAWLFAHLQALLRGLVDTVVDPSELIRLDARLEGLQRALLRHAYVPVTLPAFREQVGNQIRRLDLAGRTIGRLQSTSIVQPSTCVAPSFAMPSVVLTPTVRPELPAAYVKPKRRRILPGLLVGVMSFAAIGWIGWQGWLANPENDKRSMLSTLLLEGHDDNRPVDLDSLMLFDAGSEQLNTSSTKPLIKVLDAIKAKPDWLIVITGHSDMTGDSEQNLRLSRARASAVRDWLQGVSDIPGSCFVINGVAASQPVASNDTAVGRAANRRVDIRLMPLAGACG
jgi:type VI secretion system protein VasL